MTPDLLNKISSIVNKELIPQSLSEINEPENKQASAGATQSQSNQNFDAVANKLRWRSGAMKQSNSKYKAVSPTSDLDKMNNLSFFRCSAKRVVQRKVNNENKPISLNGSDYVFKDEKGNIKIVRGEESFKKEFEGTTTEVTPRRGYKIQYAVHTGSDISLPTGSEKLKSGQYLIKDGENFAVLTKEQFFNQIDTQ